MSSRFSFLSILLIAVVGCDPAGTENGGGDTDPKSCTEDFDCTFDQVCRGATGEKKCETAGVTDTRSFGQVDLDFQGLTDEKHLLVVYSVPTNDGEAFATETFNLTSALKTLSLPLRPVRSTERHQVSEEMRNHVLFERQRRARLDRLIDDLRAQRITLTPANARAGTGCPTACGAGTLCWGGNCEPDTAIPVKLGATDITCSLLTVVDPNAGGGTTAPEINVLVDNAYAGVTTFAQTAAEDFGTTLVKELELFGLTSISGDMDRDGDGRLTVIYSDQGPLATQTVGFFDFYDFLPTGQPNATGNEADILWIKPPTSAGAQVGATGTMAHELVHIISYATRVEARADDALREVLWLDEGLAHLVEDLVGWGPSLIPKVENALLNWTIDAGFASNFGPSDPAGPEITMRGQAFMLLRHMVDQRGSGGATSSATLSVAGQFIRELIAEDALGFEHARFQNANPDFLYQWLVAVYGSGNVGDYNTAAHAYDYLTTGTNATTGHTSGIAGWGTFPASDPGGAILRDADLFGPEVTDVDLTSSPPDDLDIYRSGSIFFEFTDFNVSTENIIITGTAPAGVDLRMKLLRVK